MSAYRLYIIQAVLISFFAVDHAQADSQTQVQQALTQIGNTADRICNIIQTYGNSTSVQAKAEIKAELSKFASVLGNAGLDGNGNIATDRYNNVERKDLAGLLDNNAKCKLEIFKELKSIIPGINKSLGPDDPRWSRNQIAATRAYDAYRSGRDSFTVAGDWYVHTADTSSKDRCYAYTKSKYSSAGAKLRDKGLLLIHFDAAGDTYFSVKPSLALSEDSVVIGRLNTVPYDLSSDGRLAFIVSIPEIQSIMRNFSDEDDFALTVKTEQTTSTETYSMRGANKSVGMIIQACLRKCNFFGIAC